MPKRKLLKKQVIEIFEQFYEGKDEYWLAKRYKVSPETVRDIINRRTWKSLDLKPIKEMQEERMLKSRAYQALLDDGHSVFEIAMLNDTTPHLVAEDLKWYQTL